jgi:hypothetical protein
MRTVQSLVTRREKDRERKARWRMRKEAVRVLRNKDEPIRGEWRGKFAFTITYQNRMDGTFHALDFYLPKKRVNSFRVTLDGQPWREQISATDAMAWLRAKLPKFRLHI